MLEPDKLDFSHSSQCNKPQFCNLYRIHRWYLCSCSPARLASHTRTNCSIPSLLCRTCLQFLSLLQCMHLNCHAHMHCQESHWSMLILQERAQVQGCKVHASGHSRSGKQAISDGALQGFKAGAPHLSAHNVRVAPSYVRPGTAF